MGIDIGVFLSEPVFLGLRVLLFSKLNIFIFFQKDKMFALLAAVTANNSNLIVLTCFDFALGAPLLKSLDYIFFVIIQVLRNLASLFHNHSNEYATTLILLFRRKSLTADSPQLQMPRPLHTDQS